MTHAELEFVVFCIEEFAEKFHIPSDKVYHLMQDKTKLITEYIVPNYEVLHSLGREAF